jgi:hypothetical protein
LPPGPGFGMGIQNNVAEINAPTVVSPCTFAVRNSLYPFLIVKGFVLEEIRISNVNDIETKAETF